MAQQSGLASLISNQPRDSNILTSAAPIKPNTTDSLTEDSTPKRLFSLVNNRYQDGNCFRQQLNSTRLFKPSGAAGK